MSSASLNVKHSLPKGTLHAPREDVPGEAFLRDHHKRDLRGLDRELQLFVTEVGDAKNAPRFVNDKRECGAFRPTQAAVKGNRLDKRFLARVQNNIDLNRTGARSERLPRDLKHGFSPVSKQIKNFQNDSGKAHKPADKRFHGFLRGVAVGRVGEHTAIIPRIHSKEHA